MNPNQTTKPAFAAGRYFKYAIGEIILVVIGILIALQINNWNENVKSTRLAEIYINDIREDLIKDTIMFNKAINRVQKTIADNKTALSLTKQNSVGIDSLNAILSMFHSTRVYQINNATYIKLLNTGFLDSNTFHNLFSNINTYYTKEYVAYSEYIEWDEEQSIDKFHNDFLGDYKNNLDLSSLLSEHSKDFSTNEFENSLEAIRAFIVSNQFRNKVLANYLRKERVVDRIKIQKQLATTLLETINKENIAND